MKNHMTQSYINRFKWAFKKAKMSMDKFLGKIGRKTKKKIIIDGIVGWKRIEMVIWINGVSGKKISKVIMSLEKNGVKFIIFSWITGKERHRNILIIWKIRPILLMLLFWNQDLMNLKIIKILEILRNGGNSLMGA